MIFESRAISLHKSINEIKSLMIEIPHPTIEYHEFKNSKCFRKSLELVCELVCELFNGKFIK